MNNKGSIIVLFIPIVLILFFVSLFVIDVAKGFYVSERLQTVADATVLSSVRIRMEGLSRIAERWEEFGRLFIRGDVSGLEIHSSSWNEIQTKAARLKRSLSGYKGRTKAVIKVVADANGVNRNHITLVDSAASDLGVMPVDQWVRDETGRAVLLEGAWYKRGWAAGDRLGQPEETSVHQINLNLPLNGKNKWTLVRGSVARLRWDVPDNALIRFLGNGGFPVSWSDALVGQNVDPHRFPLYRTEHLQP